MKKIIIAMVIGLMGYWPAAQAAGALKAHPDSKAWDDLFAADLSNAIAPAGVWSWKDGVLSSKDKDEALWSQQDYEKFVLDLEFKLEETGWPWPACRRNWS